MKLIYEPPIFDQIMSSLNGAYLTGKSVTGIELTKEERHRLYASCGKHLTHIYHSRFGDVPIVKAEANL